MGQSIFGRIRSFFAGKKTPPGRKVGKFKRRESHEQGPPTLPTSKFGVSTFGNQPANVVGGNDFNLKRWLDHNGISEFTDEDAADWHAKYNLEPDWVEGFSSSNISGYRYFPNEQRLQVSFHDGSIYSYYSISSRFAEGMDDAPSKGRYLKQWIEGLSPYHEDTDFPRKFRKWPAIYR